MGEPEEIKGILPAVMCDLNASAAESELTPEQDPIAERNWDQMQQEAGLSTPEADKAARVIHDIPLRYHKWRHESFGQRIQREILPFIQDKNIWSLYLHGGTGTKKTSLATAILMYAREAKEHPHEQRLGDFVPIYDAVQRLRSLDSLQQTMRYWRRSLLLVLDDLGKSRDTPHVKEQLLFVLHARYDGMSKTIVTANVDLDGLAQHIDGATASRFQEGVVLDLGDTDARRGVRLLAKAAPLGFGDGKRDLSEPAVVSAREQTG